MLFLTIRVAIVRIFPLTLSICEDTSEPMNMFVNSLSLILADRVGSDIPLLDLLLLEVVGGCCTRMLIVGDMGVIVTLGHDNTQIIICPNIGIYY